MIPKVIHYCWFGGSPFPPLAEKCLNSWKEKLPDYQIKRWDESNSPIEQCLYANDAFKAKCWAFVADYVRCYALFHEGGIYLDTDMLVLKPLDPFLHHPCFLGLEEIGRANCAIIGSVRQHRFIQEVLQYYESLSFAPPHSRKKTIIIPQIMTDILVGKGMANEDSLQEIFDVHIYPVEYFYPYPFDIHRQQLGQDFSIENCMSYAAPNSYAIHLWNWSWKPAVPAAPWYKKYLKQCENFIKHNIRSRFGYMKKK